MNLTQEVVVQMNIIYKKNLKEKSKNLFKSFIINISLFNLTLVFFILFIIEEVSQYYFVSLFLLIQIMNFVKNGNFRERKVQKVQKLRLLETFILTIAAIYLNAYIECNQKLPFYLLNIPAFFFFLCKIKIYFVERCNEDMGTIINFFFCIFGFFYLIQCISLTLKLEAIVDCKWKDVFWPYWLIFSIFTILCMGNFFVVVSKGLQSIAKEVPFYQFAGSFWFLIILMGNTLNSCFIVIGISSYFSYSQNKKMLNISVYTALSIIFITLLVSTVLHKYILKFLKHFVTVDQNEINQIYEQVNNINLNQVMNEGNLNQLNTEQYQQNQDQLFDNNLNTVQSQNQVNLLNQQDQNNKYTNIFVDGNLTSSQIHIPKLLQKFSGTYFKKISFIKKQNEQEKELPQNESKSLLEKIKAGIKKKKKMHKRSISSILMYSHRQLNDIQKQVLDAQQSSENQLIKKNFQHQQPSNINTNVLNSSQDESKQENKTEYIQNQQKNQQINIDKDQPPDDLFNSNIFQDNITKFNQKFKIFENLENSFQQQELINLNFQHCDIPINIKKQNKKDSIKDIQFIDQAQILEQQGFKQESVDKNITLKCKQNHKRAASSINMKTRELSFFNENGKNNQCLQSKNTESNTSRYFDVTSNQNQQIQSIVEKNKCMICFDKPPDSVLMDCGHGGICYDCSLEIWMNIGQCHLCRDEIVQVLRIDLNKDKGSYLEVISSTQLLNNQKSYTQQKNYQQYIDIQDQNNQESQNVVQDQHINQQQINDEENEN